MPKLIDLQTQQELDLSENILKHGCAMVGRLCEPMAAKAGMSRYHATIFEYLDGLYLIDHSKNGTWYQAPASAEIKQAYSAVTESKVAPSHKEVLKAKKEGKAGHIELDRDSETKYRSGLKRVLKALQDPKQRENYASFGLGLRDGMKLFFGVKENAYEFKA